MRETDLIKSILHEFGSWPTLRLWRANVLVARTRTGQVVRAGVVGQADISGIRDTGQRIEIECKVGRGQQTEAQRNWQAMIERFGGLYVLARDVEDVRVALRQPHPAPPR